MIDEEPIAQHHHPEYRRVVKGSPEGSSLLKAIRNRVEPLGGEKLDIAPREPMRSPPMFKE